MKFPRKDAVTELALTMRKAIVARLTWTLTREAETLKKITTRANSALELKTDIEKNSGVVAGGDKKERLRVEIEGLLTGTAAVSNLQERSKKDFAYLFHNKNPNSNKEKISCLKMQHSNCLEETRAMRFFITLGNNNENSPLTAQMNKCKEIMKKINTIQTASSSPAKF